MWVPPRLIEADVLLVGAATAAAAAKIGVARLGGGLGGDGIAALAVALGAAVIVFQWGVNLARPRTGHFTASLGIRHDR